MYTIPNNASKNVLKSAFWRFSLLFIFFYIVPNDIGYLVGYENYDPTTWNRPIMWIGENLYGWEFNLDRLFQGFDSRFEVSRYTFVTLAGLIGTCIWLLIDRYFKKKYTNTVKIAVQTILRYHLGIVLIDYGLSKIFMLQFGTIGIDTLEKTIGEVSGMGLMWNFLSFSEVVVMFSGWMEFIGGFLLFFRKTTFLGAMILLGIMANVVIMDIGYGITLTMFAILLFCFILLLISTQLKSLFTYFVLNKTTKPNAYNPLVKSKKIRIVFKVFLLSLIGYFYAKDYSERIVNETENRYAWFTNLQTVETFVINGDTLSTAAKEKNSKAWRKISFNGLSYYTESFEITKEDNKKERFKFEIDSTTHKIRFRPYHDETKDWNEFSYQKIAKRKYTFEGIYEGDTIYIAAKTKLLNDYMLMYYKKKQLLDTYYE
ncbi:DoxX family protein [Kordia sp. YSTF-M3]|uniref:DoxX family protein n=1 Tax=Kordia aestuariivivens TaxID=2759037 RepID=A0ABR7Q936_9FLAO|nr:DoxX family protein [Kordia aestuariivivens]MBC8755047.1 DoxX family protein [Kordia aestuariivivens]